MKPQTNQLKALGFLLFLTIPLGLFSRAFYVSSGGDDLNDGLSIGTAWKTFNNINLNVFSPGDSILLEGGSSFTGTIYNLNKFNGTLAQPILFGSYGTGRATILSGTQTALTLEGSNVIVQDLIFTGAGAGTMSMNVHGIIGYIDLAATTPFDNLTLDNIEVSGYGGWGCLLYTDAETFGFDNLIVENSSFHANGYGGMFVYGYYTPLLQTTRNNHNGYFNNNLFFDNLGRLDKINSWSGCGLSLFGMVDGLVEHCEAYNNGYNNNFKSAGPIGIMIAESNRVTVQYCSSHDNDSGDPLKLYNDGGGFCLDGGTENCVIQYCESYGNWGAGYGIYQFPGAGPTGNDTIRYCKSTNDAGYDFYGSITLWGADSSNMVKDAFIYQNEIIQSLSTRAALRSFYTFIANTQMDANSICLTNGAVYVKPNPLAAGISVSNSIFPCNVVKTITTAASSYGTLCNATDNNISVAFAKTGTYTGNYVVQISNASGFFPNNSTSNLLSPGSTTSPIIAKIPAGTAAGSRYRVRVLNGSTRSGNNNGTDIRIDAQPNVPAIAGGSSRVCINFDSPAFTNSTPGGSWSILNGTGTGTISQGGVVTGLTVGTMNVVYTVVNGVCSASASSPLVVNNTMLNYRTTATGNWSSPSTWEMSNDNSSWEGACSYPTAANSNAVSILASHIITLDLNCDVDKLTINGSDGKLIIPSSANITIMNGQSGADLIVNGILEDGGNTSNGVDFEDNTGTANDATWLLGANGTIIKTNGGSSNYRDFYETSIANIPATATWIYRKAINNPTLYVASGTLATPMYYPNLRLENTYGGTFSSGINPNPNLSTFTFIGNNNPIIIKGGFAVGSTGIYDVNFSNINTSATVKVMGNLSINTGSTLTNIGGANYGNGFEVAGSIINNGTLQSTYNASNAGSGMLKLSGASLQTVSGAGTFNLHDLTVENAPGGSVELLTNIPVPNQLTLNNGVITTHDAATGGLLTLGSATNSVNGSLPGPGPFAYINGPMAKQFAIGASVRFNFPIGKSSAPVSHGVYNPAGVKPVLIAGGNTTFTAEYFYSPYSASSGMGPNVLAISSKEYWEISKSGGNVANTARVILNYRNPGNNNWGRYITNFDVDPAYAPCSNCNVAVVHRDAVTHTWDFTKSGGDFNSTDPEFRHYTNEGEIYSAPTSNFSPFTLAYAYNVILILPVKLVSFSGTLTTTDGKLTWSVAESKDLAGFELEYSTDGLAYRKLADVGANGNSTNFSFLHKDLPPGTNFYRLLVKDKSGNQFYSQVVLLRLGQLKTYVIGLSPTVVTDQVVPVIFSAERQEAEGMITDVLGRRIALLHQRLEPGANQWRIQTGSLARGTYFLSITTKDGLKETRRFIKE